MSQLEQYLPRHAADRARLDARTQLELHGLPPTMRAMAIAALDKQTTARAVYEEASRWVRRWQAGRRLMACARDGICEWCLRHFRAGSVHPCMPLDGQADEPAGPFDEWAQSLVDELRSLPTTEAEITAAEAELATREPEPLPEKLRRPDAWVGQGRAFERAIRRRQNSFGRRGV
jgi:hypothetical protein